MDQVINNFCIMHPYRLESRICTFHHCTVENQIMNAYL